MIFDASSYPLISVAPMMDYTDRHFRYVIRQMTKKTLLYTEMITTQAIIHGDRHKLLDFSAEEKPVALQLGGDNPQDLAKCAKIGADWGYDEINLNVGCPSARVQSGNFGACLMASPDLVAQCVEAMQSKVNIPITVKHRIGIDHQDQYEDMKNFVGIVSQAGCQRFIVHARKAWLQGLNPKQNREIPPLRYHDVYQLKRDFPHLKIDINGGITTLEQAQEHLQFVDGVMIGRAAYDNPYLFAFVDRDIYHEDVTILTREEIIRSLYPYIDFWASRNVKLNSIMRHLLQIFAKEAGSKVWKRYLSENGNDFNLGSEVVEQALKLREQAYLSFLSRKSQHQIR